LSGLLFFLALRVRVASHVRLPLAKPSGEISQRELADFGQRAALDRDLVE
jgi:hypothetical protein